MARKGREKSPVGAYMILVEGRAGAALFEEKAVRSLYLNRLLRGRQDWRIEVLAYVFLKNSLRAVLLEKRGGSMIGLMQGVQMAFSKEYRKRFPEACADKRLFRDRYYAEALSSEAAVLQAVSVLHDLPVRKGLVQRAEDYEASSLHEYEKLISRIDTAYVLEALHFQGGMEALRAPARNAVGSHAENPGGNSRGNSRGTPRGNSRGVEKLRLQEAPAVYGRSDEEARAIIENYLEGGLPRFIYLSEEEQRALLSKLRHEAGLAIRQLERLTGYTKGVLQRL